MMKDLETANNSDSDGKELLLSSSKKANNEETAEILSSMPLSGKILCILGAIFWLAGATGLLMPCNNAPVALEMQTSYASASVGLSEESTTQNSSSDSFLGKHIKPIKPMHHAEFQYYTTATESGAMAYRREFVAPCGYGVLVFNIGPAAEYEPFHYDVYEDAYVYSNNNGMCFFYPSYRGVQKGDAPFWKMTDPTDGQVPLGDNPNRISTRVVIQPKTKEMDPTQGGDFLVVRKGNYYNPGYYKSVQNFVHSLKMASDEDVHEQVTAFLEQLE